MSTKNNKNKGHHVHNRVAIAGDYQYNALTKGNHMQRQWHKNRHNLINYLHFLSNDDIVLDVGCGSGNVIFEFAPKVKKITGIDNNVACISFINRGIKEKKIKNASVKEMDILEMKLNQTFSRVILTEVIEHFDKKSTQKLLRQINSVMKKGDKLLITTPNYQSLWVLLEKMIDILHLTPSLWGDQHLIKFTPYLLTDVVQREGFTIEKVGTLNLLSPFLAIFNTQLADKVSRKEFNSGSFGNLIYLVAIKQ